MSGYDKSPDYSVPIRIGDLILTILILILIAALMIRSAEGAPPREIAGKVSVSDGDTIKIGGQRIRLWGVDAPERSQDCGNTKAGQLSASALVKLAQGKDARCEVRDTDQYGRPVAVCRVAGVDLGASQVRDGWAWDYKQFSKGFYSGDERLARDSRRGVWALSCEKPWDYRQR